MKKLFVFALFISFLNISAESSILKKYAANLSELRKEIQIIINDIEREKTISSSDILSLADRKNSLENELRIINMELLEAERKKNSYAETIRKHEAPFEKTKAVLVEKIDLLAETVKNGIPFRIEERINYLEEIKSEILSLKGDMEFSSMKLFQFIEDELKMSKETVLTKIPLKIESDDTPVLTNVIRVGTLMLLTERNGKYGMVHRDAKGSWTFREIKEKKEVKKTGLLFDSFNKKINSGFFHIPVVNEGGDN